jgi:hypothetical protein
MSVILLGASLGGLACAKKEGKPVDVKSLMEARCSTCHFSTDIYTVVKTPEQWKLTVERMRRINPDLMSVEETALITAYLQKHASKN